jgi:plastocyanin
MTGIRATVLTAGVGFAILLSACGNGPPAQGGGGGGGASIGVAGATLGTPVVKVIATSALQFSPKSATAKVGQVVQWMVAQDSVPHNVTWDADQTLNSPQTVGPGETWQVKFTVAGAYTYHCTIHPGMDGQITISG